MLERGCSMGASLAPAPGPRHWRQRFVLSKLAQPGNVRNADAETGRSVKHTNLSFSPAAAAGP
eukprot:7510869-Pyramimonas_sp.AAC.1